MAYGERVHTAQMSKKTNIGDWARLSDSLWTKPKVLRIAEILGGQRMLALADPLSGQMLMRHATCSALSRVYVTVNRHAHHAGDGTNDAVLSDVTTETYLDMVADMPGIQRAMREVGWAVYDPDLRELRFPNYLEYNTLMKGTGKRGRPGDPCSPGAVKKRAQREKMVHGTNGGTNARQITHQAGDKEPDKLADVDKDADKDKDPQTPSVLEAVKVQVSELREVWRKSPWWTPTEETALLGALRTWQGLNVEDLCKLKWFFSFADRKPDQCGGAVTGRRDAFLDNLTGYMQRAHSIWVQQGRPELLGRKPKKPTVKDPPLPTPEESAAAASRWRSEFLAPIASP